MVGLRPKSIAQVLGKERATMSDMDPITGENSPEGKPGTRDAGSDGYGTGGDVQGKTREPVAPREKLAREDG
jgi:hypothetical protein